MKNVSLLIPYRPDYGPRDKIFHWVKNYYEELMPQIELCIGECDTELFSRSQAINNAAKKATRDVFVISDSDIIYEPSLIYKSIEQLNNYAWVIPYQRIHYIDEQSTNQLLKEKPICPTKIELIANIVDATNSPLYDGYIFTGGINVLPRKDFEFIGGFDERFLGWGGEDDAFNAAMSTLCGHYGRLDTDIYHLWHPPAPGSHYSTKDHTNLNENKKLALKYQSANGSKELMQQILENRNNGDKFG